MNIKTKLRWGILGAARINERLLPAIVEASNARLVAIASRRPGAAAQTLAQYAPHHQQNVQTYDNLEALLNDPDVEAVYLPLANREHAEWALRAIECGKHVLCEKPMALTVSDIEAIKTAASKQKVTAMEGFMYRFHPQHARVLELIRLGTIGEVRSVRASYSFMMKPARIYRLIESVWPNMWRAVLILQPVVSLISGQVNTRISISALSVRGVVNMKL
jgi:xylose dehydrogenase (NAD/NADP)